ncbi:MAG: hypothetical protein ACPHVC_01435 [Flavobacteriaceae bacterium]
MKNTQLSSEESLALIAKSIQQTKTNLNGQRFYYLFWGWAVLITSFMHYLLAINKTVEAPYLVWPVMGVVGFLSTLFYGYKYGKKTGYVETHLDRTLKHLWIVIGISLFAVLWIFIHAYQSNPMAIISVLIGVGTLVSGLHMRFKPLVIGGVGFFVGAIALVYVSPLKGLLIYDVCIIIGYLIPGYMLKKELS